MPNKKLNILSINYEIANWNIRELAIHTLKNLEIKFEHFIIETCNRVELVVWSDDLYIEELLKIETLSIAKVYKSKDAMEHLIYLCSGLKSQSFGDPQIFGQVKSSYFAFRDLGKNAKALLKVFNEVCEKAKTIRRTFFNTSNNNPTAKTIAIKIREFIFNNKKAKILLLGAGDMAMAIMPCINQFSITIASRTEEKAKVLSKEFNCSQRELNDAIKNYEEYDIVISCLKVDSHILEVNTNKEMIIFDLGFPPNIQMKSSQLYYHIDHFPDLVTEESFIDYVLKQSKLLLV